MLEKLAIILEKNKDLIDQWYENKINESAKPRCLYSSVDIRFSGNKLVPVDTNLFPAGFNNLDQSERNKSVEIISNYLKTLVNKNSIIALISEDHTRNLNYLDNIKTIQEFIISAGYQCYIASLTATESISLNGIIHNNIEIKPLKKFNGKAIIEQAGYPELIILNNDLMLGIPENITDIEQPVIPNPNLGWFKRRKSNHFLIYNELMKELEKKFGIPSYFLTAEYDLSLDVDFKNKSNLDELNFKCNKLLEKIKENYNHHQINDVPYLVVKSNYGTYGMGVMIIKDPEEIFSLNKKTRNQMNSTKNSVKNTEVIIQEGISSVNLIDGYFAEPLIYMIDHKLVSFLYRSHPSKDAFSNLNSSGMLISRSLRNESASFTLCCEFVAKIATLASLFEN